MDCIFCKIIDGDIPSYKVYEDDLVLAFLDVNPLSTGHTLIVPRNHTLDINTISDDLLLHILNCGREIGNKLIDRLGADGISLAQNNGIAQEVKHFHLHVIPKYKNKKEMTLGEVVNKMNS